MKSELHTTRYLNLLPGDDTCCIMIYGDIGADANGKGIAAEDIVADLRYAEMNYEHIDVRINSYGGDVFCGIAIFNALRQSKADIHIYIDGVAASMASIIALCGKPVQMSRYARLMIHQTVAGCYGSKEAHRNCADQMEQLETTLAAIYAERMNTTVRDIIERFYDGKDHWFNAADALSAHLIDGIYDIDPEGLEDTAGNSEEAINRLYNSINNRLNHKEPQTENDMKIEEIQKINAFKDCKTETEVAAAAAQLQMKAEEVEKLSGDAKTLKEENAKLQEEIAKLKEQLKEATDTAGKLKAEKDKKEEEEIKSALDKAITDGRIQEKDRELYNRILLNNKADALAMLNTMPKARKVMDDIENPDGPKAQLSIWQKRMQDINNKINS